MRGVLERVLPATVRQSYVAKIAVAFALIAAVIGVAGVGLYVQTDEMLATETKTELESAAQIEATAIDEWIDRMRLQVRSLAEARPLAAENVSAANRHLWNAVERDDDIEAAFLVDTADGTVLASVGSSRTVSASSVSTASGQRAVTSRVPRTDAVSVSRPFRPYEGSAPVLLLSSGVPGRSDRTLVVVVNLNRLSSSQPHRLDDAEFQVVNDSGTVVMDENGSRILSQTRLASVPGSGAGFLMQERDREDVAVGYASLEHRNWTVRASMPTERAFALRSAVLRGVLAMIGIVSVGFACFTFLLARTTVRPLRDLAAKARALRGGDIDEPIETDRVDEFGDLYESFDAMRSSLRRQIERAESARRESEALSAHLEQEAERFGRVMAACADGDLERRLDPTSDNEAMREIARAFNDMMDDVEQAHEELEAFASIISHDLRNPLNVASGRARLLEEECDSEHLRPTIDALDRMEAIIEDGLTLARGSYVEETEAVALDEHAREAWRHVDSSEATLRLSTDETVRCDPDLLEQLFENLYRNAIEHAGTDVTVTVASADDGFVVEDDGPGIPEADLPDVFEPGVSDGSGGTGLGLTIVSRIADAHGWDVRATNADGARFTVVTADVSSERQRPAPVVDGQEGD